MDQQITKPEVKKISEEGNTTVFEIEPLFPGYGMTVGNSLRRVLLSSLPGAASYQVKIVGVSHEFSTIPEIKEDVVELILNLKSLRFKLEGDEKAVAKLDVSGPKKITGKDFKLPSSLEIMNPDQHIATLGKGAKLKFELFVDKGIGYVPVEQRSDEKPEPGVIALDSLYTPVRKVHYEVENTRVGQMTDYDKITLDITTDGTIDATAALERAGQLLKDHFELIAGTGKEVEKFEKKQKDQKEAHKTAESRKIKIEDAGFSNRTMNALIANGVKTLGGLAKVSEEKLAEFKGLGGKSMEEIEKILKKNNLA